MESSSSSLPRRCIFNDTDLQHFLSSPTKRSLLHFTETLGQACRNGDDYDPAQPLRGLSPGLACLHGALQGLGEWIDADTETTPSAPSSHRFGNPRFRTYWLARLQLCAGAIVTAILSYKDNDNNEDAASLEEAHAAGLAVTRLATETDTPRDDNVDCDPIRHELSLYLLDAFGHAIRLDYGTGHETSFHIFLYALRQLQVMGAPPLSPARGRAVALALYHQYLQVTRKLQTSYRLEPAGSHGVWGLDDFYCLPFYFGACQLAAREEDSTHAPRYTPAAIHDDALLNAPENDGYLYFTCIRFIRTIKKNVPFFESSPMLNDISHLPNWHKVATGLLRLYEGEVLSQLPVVQHILFGRLFPCTWTPSPAPPAAPTQALFRNLDETPAPWAAARK